MALGPASSAAEIVAHLRSIGSEANRQGLLRFGIRIDDALGIPHAEQRKIAKAIGRDHERAFVLWNTGIAEARFIAARTADPTRFSVEDAWRWTSAFNSWDIVDGVSDLFVATQAWKDLIGPFAEDERVFVRRTAFAMIAWSVVHRKQEPDETFLAFLPIIRAHATDDRNFVWKAVSWALRSLGKRSASLNEEAVAVAEDLAAAQTRAARRIGRAALRELTAEKTLVGISRREAARARKKARPQPSLSRIM